MMLTHTTRLDKITDAEHLFFLDRLMAASGKFFRTAFNRLYWKDDREHFKDIYLALKKSEYVSKFGLSVDYANSLILDAWDKVKMHKREAESYKEKATTELDQLRDKLETDTKKYQSEQQILAQIKRPSIIEKHRKIVHLLKKEIWETNRRIEQIEKSLKKDSVTFGEKKNQRKLSRGEISSEDWEILRNSFAYNLGRSDSQFGNREIQIVDATHLKVKGTDGTRKLFPLEFFHSKRGKMPTAPTEKLTSGINRLQDIMDADCRTCRITRSRKNKKTKYFLHVTIEYPDYEIESDRSRTHRRKVYQRNKQDKKQEMFNRTKRQRNTEDYIRNTQPQDLSDFVFAGIDLNVGFLAVFVDSFNMTQINYKMSREPNESGRQSLRMAVKEAFAFIKKAYASIDPKHEKKICVRIEHMTIVEHPYSAPMLRHSKKRPRFLFDAFQKFCITEGLKQKIYVQRIQSRYTSVESMRRKLFSTHIGAAQVIAEGGVSKEEMAIIEAALKKRSAKTWNELADSSEKFADLPDMVTQEFTSIPDGDRLFSFD